MKFGGAAVHDVSQFEKVAQIVKNRCQKFSRVVVVVSAMGSMTDDLVNLGKMVHPNPPKREVDMLVSIGERVSISLLAMALDLQGIEAVSFTGSQSGIITTDDHGEAKIVEVRPRRVLAVLEENKVAIVAGFQGMGVGGDITTLGRDGSDISAVAIAGAVGASCVEFYKDIPGIGSANPKVDPDTKIFEELSYEEAMGCGALHKDCISLAKKYGVALQIRAFYSPEKIGTRIGPCMQHS